MLPPGFIAHPGAHEITERYRALVPSAVGTPGLPPATFSCVDLTDWDELIDVESKPMVDEGLSVVHGEAGPGHPEHAPRQRFANSLTGALFQQELFVRASFATTV